MFDMNNARQRKLARIFLHSVFMDYFLILSMAKVRAGME